MLTQDFSTTKVTRWNRIVSGQETVEIGRTPKEAIYQRDILTVYRFERETPATQKHPILIAYSLINRPAVLDLLPGRSVVERFLEAGFEVYLIDWGVPTALDYHSGLDTYVNLYIRSAIRETLKHSGCKELHLFGYCMGGALAAIATALRPRGIKSLTLLGTPLNFRSEELLYRWSADPNVNKPEKLVEAWRVAPAWNFESFSLLTLDKKPDMLKALYNRLEDEGFVESYMAMERWVGDNIPMAASVFQEFVRGSFLNNDLYEGRMEVGGKKVDLGAIKVPVLSIIGEADHLVPPETTGIDDNPFPNGEYLRFPSGHVGLSVSSKSHKLLWPQVCNWLCNQDATKK
ncbi:MAG TPA: alpha/beta fold hydrolase [Phycisphaerales bacterium]|nr:alpha/beta fold hydrolase [Phycisphaerales bacterium]